MTMKINAEEFSLAGDQYIGRPYSEMDCQAFVERCMRDCGLRMDLAGSNAWYREVRKHGWVGSPEECIRKFGMVPKGALLFILKQDGKEPGKYRHDGIGNASHIGICIQRNEGAINSSSSRGCVCYSKFANKSINGGWNRVGLYDRFTYGKGVDWVLEHDGIGDAPAGETGEESDQQMEAEAVVTAPRAGETVNMRKDPDGDLICRLADGERVTTTGSTREKAGHEWSQIRARGKTGWVWSDFLTADDGQLPADDPDGMTDGGEAGPGETVQIELSLDACANAYPLLRALCEQIEAKAGRG